MPILFLYIEARHDALSGRQLPCLVDRKMIKNGGQTFLNWFYHT